MTHAQDIEEKAAAWLARRDAGLSSGEEGEFMVWLAADARHRAAYLRLAQAWERSARLERLRPPGDAIDPDLLTPHGPRSVFHPFHPSPGFGPGEGRGRERAKRWRTPLAVAASLAAIVTVAAWWAFAPQGVRTYRTEVGGLSRVVLKDGSAVTLNTDTEIRVRFTEARREIRLLHGEAQFQVAHDARHPFEVEAAGRIVRAVGTAFDVRLSSSQSVEVVVTEGKVALVDPGGAANAGGRAEMSTVSAGESAVATGREVTVRSIAATEASRRLAWEQGELSFQGETLAQAVEEFNRYNQRKLKVDDPSLAQLAIGGNFQALDVDSFVAALDRSFGIHSKVDSDGTVLLERAALKSE